MFQDSDSDKQGGLAKSDQLSPILLAMGSNLASSFGPPEKAIRESQHDLKSAGINILAASRLFRTPAFPIGSGPDFVNAAALCNSVLSPGEILKVLLQIEEKYGRQRENRWGARTLDIDLIAVGDLVLPDNKTHALWRNLPLDEQKSKTPDALILPHPRLQERAFVLLPLADVAADWKHPILGRSVAEMLEDLPQIELEGIEPV